MASRFAAIALGHVAREYPHKADHVFNGPQDIGPHRTHHPIFFGSFDWHSCVHGYWTLATCLRLHPDIPQAPAIRALFDDSFTTAKVEAERAYLDRPGSAGFERPYGWAWLLMLAAELSRHDGPWAANITPLARAFADRFKAFLPKATYPLRAGVHSNTAFALRLAVDYAETCGDPALAELARRTAIGWYRGDAGCQAWEPSGDEFLSPALMEAECLRRMLPAAEFSVWFGRFLPDIDQRLPATLFTPATVSDRSDGKIAHLDGLNLSRAWCWRGIAQATGSDVAREAAETHLASALPHVAGDYMGEHWLASFALLALLA
ncbi:hypothetical protein QO010_002283 [Caulobacter ginsengisoli]|uniref:DUF2891 domain-containing protein n=1 Tax=Caulobacter ginsengisoli TaxID=400775 RepID=A0ABU0IR65_9CAUL|nr:DUF2891 domain-containing protein [Caulobacter ginsengisoli]MDQ0464502.1 hypothetical protein [Caulobacter ginsengisoli]